MAQGQEMEKKLAGSPRVPRDAMLADAIRALVDFAPEGVALVDQTSHQIVYANRAAAHMLRADAARLAGQSIIAAAVHPQPGGGAPEALLQEMAQEVMARRESVRRWRLRRIDGILIDAEVRVILLPGEAGMFRVSLIDLTAQTALEEAAVRSQAALRASEARFRHLTRISSDWYWESGTDGRFTSVEGGTDAQAAARAGLIGRLPWEVRRFEVVETGWDEVRACWSRRSAYRQVLRYLVASEPGEVPPVMEIAAEPLFDAEGAWTGYRGVARDITARVRAEAELKESERHFRRLTEIASDYKWATDAEHRFIELVADAGGLVRGDALGKRRWDIPHLRPLGGNWDAHRLTLDARQPFDDLTVEVLGTDGRRRFRRISGEPVFDPHLGFTGYRGVGIDVSNNQRQTLKRSGEARLFEALARGESIAALMEILCEVIEGVTERPSRAAVMQVVDGHLVPLAASHLPDSYTSAVDGIGIEALCGAAAALNRVVVCTDTETDERWRMLRLMARNAGIRACWSTPICSADGQVIGTLAVFMGEAADPGIGDLDATASAARIAALVIDRFRAQAALRASEERLRRLVSLSSDWEWAQDEHFLFTHVGEFQGEHGRPVSASVGRARWDNPWLRPIGFTWEEHRALLEAHQPFSHTLFEFTDPARQRFYWAIRGEPVFDTAGQFRGYRGVGSDISARYRNDALRLGERALFEGMAQGATLPALSTLLAQTLCGVLERDSAVIIKEHRHSRLQPIGTHGVRPGWSTLLEHTLTLDADPTTCGEAARTGGICVAADAASEPRYAGLRDQIIALGIGATWAVPVTGSDGVVMATIGVACPAAAAPSGQDIEFAKAVARLTEFVLTRFRSAQAVRESAERYRRLVEQSQEGVLIHEFGIIEYANPAFLRMAGAPRMEDLMGMHAVKLYAKESQARAQERLARLREAGGSLGFTEMTLQRLDGGLLEVEVAANGFELHGRRMVQSQFRDISARKFTEREILNLNEELEQRVSERTSELSVANRELEAFSYTVAHDLRAPLRAIDGFSQLLKADLGGALTTETQRDLDAISTSARRMADLINGLLDFSRLGRNELNRRRVNMQALAESISAEMTGDHPVQVQIGRLPEVHGDSIMLRQVWANLIGNAVKFSAKRSAPRVTIECVVEAGEARFAVADNGDGIDMAYADKLFGVFQRMHSAEEFEGTGVGLAIVKRIVERHGGRVWVQSAPGAGASFFFTLPVSGVNAVDAVAGTGTVASAAAAATIEMKG